MPEEPQCISRAVFENYCIRADKVFSIGMDGKATCAYKSKYSERGKPLSFPANLECFFAVEIRSHSYFFTLTFEQVVSFLVLGILTVWLQLY